MSEEKTALDGTHMKSPQKATTSVCSSIGFGRVALARLSYGSIRGRKV